MLAMACQMQWGLESAEQVVAARRSENQQAADLVGADTVNFSIPDCIYRRSSSGEPLYPEEVFVPIHTFEKDLHLEIAAALASELRPDDTIVSPLAVGDHLDHVMARLTAESMGRPLWYYADIPYLVNHPEMLAPRTNGLKATLYPISEKGLEAWQSGIAAYATQIMMLFETAEKMEDALRVYWEDQHGIRLWRADP